MEIEIKKKDGQRFEDPFALYDELNELVGGEVRAIPRKGGKVYAVTVPDELAPRVLRLRALNSGEEVTVSKVIKGTQKCVWAEEVLGLSEDALLDKLRAQGVARVRRVFKTDPTTRNRTPTALLVLTFPSHPPSRISFGMFSRELMPYRSTPIRCTHCQARGHLAKRCRNGLRCANCTGTCRDVCRKAARCLDCNVDGHKTGDQACPAERAERELLKEADEKGVSRKRMVKIRRRKAKGFSDDTNDLAFRELIPPSTSSGPKKPIIMVTKLPPPMAPPVDIVEKALANLRAAEQATPRRGRSSRTGKESSPVSISLKPAGSKRRSASTSATESQPAGPSADLGQALSQQSTASSKAAGPPQPKKSKGTESPGSKDVVPPSCNAPPQQSSSKDKPRPEPESEAESDAEPDVTAADLLKGVVDSDSDTDTDSDEE